MFLPTTYYLLPTTHYLPPTTYYLLPHIRRVWVTVADLFRFRAIV
jgi:hypothetical protein